MALYSKHGCELQFLSRADDVITARRIEDNAIREYHVSDLRADGGLAEINALSL